MPASFVPDAQGSTARPQSLQVLGILTFINAGLFILIYALGALGMMGLQQMPLDEVKQVFDEGAAQYLPENDRSLLDQLVPLLHAHGAALMGIFLLRTVLRLIGAIGIWRGRRAGFHLYAAAQLLGIFAPHLILPWAFLGVGGPLLAVAMTAMYGSQLKRLS
jgi:hypothetical protein